MRIFIQGVESLSYELISSLRINIWAFKDQFQKTYVKLRSICSVTYCNDDRLSNLSLFIRVCKQWCGF